VAGREIDLSRKAAELLGYERKGTARVRVQYISRAPLPGDGGTMMANETYTMPKPQMDESEKKVAAIPKTQTVVAAALAAPVGVKSLADVAAAPLPQPTMAPIADTPAADLTPDGTIEQVPVVPGNIYVQAGSFQNFTNAESVHQKLLAEGVKNVSVSPTVVDGSKFYRVRVGPMSDVSAADASLKSISQAGNAGARIVIE
jgi:rare lipoprotein A